MNDELVGKLRYMASVEGRELAGQAADEIVRLERGLVVAAEDANYWRGAHERLSKLVAEKGLRT